MISQLIIALVFSATQVLVIVDDRRTPTAAKNEPVVRATEPHWSFSPLLRADTPRANRGDWARNPIDQFVIAKLKAVELRPIPQASRTTLIRRVTFDLTGLPPTPEEVESFVRDESPNAYEKLIDRLLASPAYGERWAQHWLDIARFAETDGFEHDLVRPNAWRYRDWVIDALNADMPYDEFVRMQIAGDERRPLTPAPLPPSGARGTHSPACGERESQTPLAPLGGRGVGGEGSVPTGFLLCGPDMPDINLQDERRHNVLNEMTSTVGSVFLGLQLGCAQCHDHKFDPITMADFYRLRAFFEPAEFFDEAPLASPEELAERERLEVPVKVERERIDKELKKFDATAHERLNKDPQVKISRDELLSALSETEKEEFQRLTDELKQLASKTKSDLPPLPMGRVLREKGGTPRPSHIMIRGDFRQPGPRVMPAFPAIANPWNSEVEIDESVAPSSGRRTALANWLTRPDHPLTTRVIVNRVWQFHFGQGLVRTPSDFGTMGEKPSHPELLDWLATEFTRPASPAAALFNPQPKARPISNCLSATHTDLACGCGLNERSQAVSDTRETDHSGLGWSLKRLHKLILTSATYMQASRPTEPSWSADERATAMASWKKSREVDPENRLLARMNRLRLDGESIRDAMLAASDHLSPRRGGPGVRPPLPDELVATLLKNQWTVTPDEEDHRRRSIYIFVRRNLRCPLFDVFDRPDTNASCPQRLRSTTAPQSLTLLNSEFSLAAARDLADFVSRAAGHEPKDHLELCYRRALSREPTPGELAVGVEFLRQQTERLRKEGRDPATLPTRVALSSNKSADPFATAALVDFCLGLFNLNEYIYVD